MYTRSTICDPCHRANRCRGHLRDTENCSSSPAHRLLNPPRPRRFALPGGAVSPLRRPAPRQASHRQRPLAAGSVRAALGSRVCARVPRDGQAAPGHPAGRARAVPVAQPGGRVGDGRRGAHRRAAGGAPRSRASWSTREASAERRRAPRLRLARRHQARQRARRARGLAVEGRRALDVGASTGGFTDCLLQRGAREVIAVDVGYGTLDYGLRIDPRVQVLERTNARALTPALLRRARPAASRAGSRHVDVSFISLAKVLGPVLGCLRRALRRARARQAAVRARPRARRQRRRGARRRRPPRGADRRGARRARARRGRAGYPLLAACPGPKGNRETFVWLAEAGREGGAARARRSSSASRARSSREGQITVFTHRRPSKRARRARAARSPGGARRV